MKFFVLLSISLSLAACDLGNEIQLDRTIIDSCTSAGGRVEIFKAGTTYQITCVKGKKHV